MPSTPASISRLRVLDVLHALDHDLAGPEVADDSQVVVADGRVHRGVEHLPHRAAGGRQRRELELGRREEVVPPPGAGDRVDDRPDGELRRDREAVALIAQRAPATGVSTVNCSVSNPAAAARRTSPYEMSRSRMTYSWNQLRPYGFAAFTSSIVVVPSVDSVKGMPAARPRMPGDLALGLHRRVKPVGAMPKGRADRPPRISTDVSTSGAGRRIPGWNSISSKAWRARERDSSPSAAPSV